MANHVMIDLETMGARPGSAILSIGAVRFDPCGAPPPNPADGLTAEHFSLNVSLDSCLGAGLRVDADTVAWWMHPDRAAGREALFGPDAAPAMPLRDALDRLSGFVPRGARVWAHGATFDPVLLETAYRATRANCPWRFWQVGDTRTLFELAFPPDGKGAGLANDHTAIGDAYRQACAVQRAYAKLGLVPSPADAA